MAERQRKSGTERQDGDKVRVVVTAMGKRFEYWVERGTSVKEVLKMVEEDAGLEEGQLQKFTVRFNNKNLERDEDDDLEDETIEEDSSLQLIQRIKGGS